MISYPLFFLSQNCRKRRKKESLKAIKAIPVEIVKAIKNEILDMIREVARRNNNRLSLPVISGKFIGFIEDRASLQNKDLMEHFVQSIGVTTFEELKAIRKKYEDVYNDLKPKRESKAERSNTLIKHLNRRSYICTKILFFLIFLIFFFLTINNVEVFMVI